MTHATVLSGPFAGRFWRSFAGRLRALAVRRVVGLVVTALAALTGCSALDALDAVTPRGEGTRSAGIPYGPGPRQTLDVYAPAQGGTQGAGGAPVIVFFYGGGWNTGRKEQYRFVAETLTAAGYVVAIPDYRIVPDAHFPDFVEDSAAAVAWVHAHIAALGGDPRRIVLIGHSAGAYNVAMLALDPRYLRAHGLETGALAGVVAISGPYDFLPLRSRLTTAAFGRAADLPATQPITFARADAPPLLLLNGSADNLVPPRHALALAERVREAGGQVRVIVYDGLGHIDIMAGLSTVLRGSSPLLGDITGFIQTLPAFR
jgi:acetyl esterase/lipase